MRGEKRARTWEALLAPEAEMLIGRIFREKEEYPKAIRESDQLIVLGDGKADHEGKGLTGIRSLQRKH